MMSQLRRPSRPARTNLWLKALENREVPALFTVTTLADNAATPPAGSLREALNLAAANTEADTITFQAGLTGTIDLTSQLSYSVTNVANSFPLLIQGPGSASLTVRNVGAAATTTRVLNISDTGGNPTVTLAGLTIADGLLSSGNGGGVLTSEPLELSDVVFTGNRTTSGSGGAVSFSSTGAFAFTDSTFNQNTSSSLGGAVHLSGASTLTLTNTSFTKNASTGSTGGAIHGASSTTLDITGGTFSENKSSSNGGAIHLPSGKVAVTVNGAKFLDNIGGSNGGAFSLAATTTTFNATDSVFSGNQAPNGGAFRITPTTPTVTLTNSTLSGNVAKTGRGGGIYFVSGSALTVVGSTFSGNTAATNGGGISFSSAGSATITNSTFSGNTANGTSGGGGIHTSSTWNGTIDLRATTIVQNAATNATGKGGGVMIGSTSGTFTIQSSIVADNTNVNHPDLGASAARTVNLNKSLVGSVDPGLITLAGTFDPALVGGIGSPVSAGVFALADNGGPTLTHILKSSSPAIDAGTNVFGATTVTTDQRGNARVSGSAADIGSVEGFSTSPFVLTVNTPAVTPGAANYQFEITYDDETGINAGTISKANVTVTGPGGTPLTVSNGVVSSSGGTQVTAQYTVDAPGGTWNAVDSGDYAIAVVAGSVADTSGNPVAAGTVGGFSVAISGVLTVDNAGDVDDGNTGPGQLTLREAIRISNGSAGQLDTITFAPALNGATITLGGSELLITDPVTLDGPGKGLLTVNAATKSRVFNINLTGTAAMSIDGLTVTGGSAAGGGGINLTDDTLTLTDVAVVANNSTSNGGGIALTTGKLIATRVLIGDNTTTTSGGGVHAGSTAGAVELIESTVDGNKASSGGGINLGSTSTTLSLVRSTVSNNTATISSTTDGGGGIRVLGTSAKVEVVNSTISGNSADSGIGGGFRNGSSSVTLTIDNSTLAKNSASKGGGIASSTLTSLLIDLNSTIVAGNTGLSASPDMYSSVTTGLSTGGDFNLVGISDPSDNLTPFQFGNSQIGSIGAPIDPLLAVLGDYGGPTRTHGLLLNSPAIDKGANAQKSLSTDQRGTGFPRVVGGAADIGAFEGAVTGPQVASVDAPPRTTADATPYQFTVVYTDNTGIDLNTLGTKDGKVDIRVSGPGFPTGADANYVSDSGPGQNVTVTYNVAAPAGGWSALNYGTYTLTMQPDAVRELDGAKLAVPEGEIGTFVSAVPLQVTTAADVTDPADGVLSLREAIVLANGQKVVPDFITFAPSLNGSTITLTATLSVADAVSITGPGAGLLAVSGNNTVRVFDFTATAGESAVSGLTVTGGMVAGSGAGVNLTTGVTVTFNGVAVTKNAATSGTGGGINLSGGAVVLNDSTVSENTASTDGGGIAATTGKIELNRSLVADNTGTGTGSDGGGVYLTTGSILVDRSTFSNNIGSSTSSTGGGGAISVSTGSVTVINSTFSANKAINGSAIIGTSSATLNISNSTLTRNIGTSTVTTGGGAIRVGSASATLTINSTVIAGNTAPVHPDITASASVTVNGTDNFIGVGSSASVTFSGFNNQIGTPGSPLDPRLDDLGDYGGPTPTHAPFSGSPLLNAGANPLGLSVDQRGLPRPDTTTGLTDIGAVEGITTNPGAAAVLTDVNAATTDAYSVVVIYTDDTGINTTTIGTGDVEVTGKGFPAAEVPVLSKLQGGGTSVTATYTFDPPNGQWSVADNGTYTVTLNDGAVLDVTGKAVAGGPLGTFTVGVPLAGLVVDTPDDVIDSGDGVLSLREALLEANANPNVRDTITFDAALSGQTLTLASELTVIDPVAITGPGAKSLTISGDDATRLFNFAITGVGAESVISGLTLTKGKAATGGAVLLADDALMLSKVIVSGNAATGGNGGAVNLTTGVLTVVDSTLSNNTASTDGGAITFSTGSVTVVRSTLSGNSATGTSSDGGAVYGSSSGTLSIDASTLNNNSSSSTVSTGGGGAISVSSTKVTVVNSTISSNTAVSVGGGIRVSSSGKLDVFNSTITKNAASGAGGGGLAVTSTASTVTLNGTIVAQNANPLIPDLYNSSTSATVTFLGDFNLIGVTNEKVILAGGSNKTGDMTTPLSARLGALANNGGPTQTHGLLFGSPAIDAGNNAFVPPLTTDQRGVARPADPALVDIGSFEGFLVNPSAGLGGPLNPVPPGGVPYPIVVVYEDATGINVSKLGPDDLVVRNTFGLAVGTLAVADVQTSATSATVTYNLTPPGGSWDVLDTGVYSVTVVGGQVFDNDTPTPNSVAETLLGNFDVKIGGAIVVDSLSDVADGDIGPGQVSLREALAISNFVPFSVETITFAGSLANGTIALGGTELLVTDPVAIDGTGVNPTVSGANKSRVFNINIPDVNGAVALSRLTVANGTGSGGGGITMTDDSLTLTNVTFRDNASTANGGAVALSTGTVTAAFTQFVNNTATSTGGGVYMSSTGSLTFDDAVFGDNTAGTNGGGFYVSGGGTVAVNRSTFSNNRANIGGAFQLAATSTITFATATVTDSAFTNNTAKTTGGGAITTGSSNLTVNQSTFSGNQASGAAGVGGAIHITGAGGLTVNNSTLTKNTAGANGGGIAVGSVSAALTLTSTVVAQNSAATPDLFNSSTATVNVLSSALLLGVLPEANLNLLGGATGGSKASPLDAKLSALGNYGGPTRTHGLLVGSPALDAGTNPNGYAFDQRGTPFARTLNAVTDIGAFEGLVAVPTASVVSLPNVPPTTTPYVFTVRFEDETSVDAATIQAADVEIVTPAGAVLLPSKVTVPASGPVVDAVFELTPPGGSWDITDNGIYTARLVGEVKDNAGNAAFPGDLGSFKVAVGATYVVDTAADVVDPIDGKLSLREAIDLSNASPGAFDLITFAPALDGSTVTLTAQLQATDPLIIQGPGADKLTVSGNDAFRIINFNIAGAGAESTISGLTFTKGKPGAAGGAVAHADDALRLENMVFTGNTSTGDGGAVNFTTGKLTAIDSVFTNNTASDDGGAIGFSTGSLSVLRSTLSGNTATGPLGDGGAIYLTTGTLSVIESTLNNNSGSSTSTTGGGGAIGATTGNITVINSTLSGNKALLGIGGAIRGSSSINLTVFASTLTNNSAGSNGGGIAVGSNSATLNISSSVIAQNVNANHPDLFSSTTTPVLAVNGTNTVFGALTDGDITVNPANPSGTKSDPLDAKLAPLANYGGPTLTHALTKFSPALGLGLDSVVVGGTTITVTTDQRGAARVAPFDAGAFEGFITSPTASVVLANVPPVDATYKFTVTFTDDTGIDLSTITTGVVEVVRPGGAGTIVPTLLTPVTGTTLVEATFEFTPPGGSWELTDNGVYTVNLVGTVEDIDGQAAPLGALGTFTVALGGLYVVDSLLDENDGDTSAGNFSLREAVGLANASVGAPDTILFAPSLFTGGAKTITLSLGELTVSDGVTITGPGADKLSVSGNNASRVFNVISSVVGGIDVVFESLTITGGNATGVGGGISANDEKVTLNRVWLTGNKSSSTGGGINFSSPGGLVVRDSAITNNTSGGVGGGLRLSTSQSALIENSTISGNTSTGAGGGIYWNSFATTANFVIRNTTITANSATGNGGGVRVTSTTGTVITMESSIVSGNTSTAVSKDIYAEEVRATNSLIGVTDGIDIVTKLGTTVTGTGGSPLDAKLGALTNNGGPTPTHALNAGSPAIDQGNNPAVLAFDQRGPGFARQSGAGVDMGAFEVQSAAKPITATVKIDDGSNQRSVVRSFTVTFSETPAFPNGVAAAFQLQRTGPASGFASGLPTGTVTGVTATPAGTVVTLTFTDPTFSEGKGSLIDGNYTLTLVADNITGAGGKLDGNGDGTGGDNQVLTTFRLFGDVNGDRDADFNDFLAFRATFGATGPNPPYNRAFDFDDNNQVNFNDFLAFRSRFGAVLGTP